MPIYLKASFFKQLGSVIMPFIWGYKPPRISKAHLHKSLKKGGLGHPNFKHYYWAANSRALTYWKYGGTETAGNPGWLKLEASASGKSSLYALLFSGSVLADKSFKNNFILQNSL